MLDEARYRGPAILDKKLMEPSFGNGAFLAEVVRRYITEGIDSQWSLAQIKEGLAVHIAGIEVDEGLYHAGLEKLNALTEAYGIVGVRWGLRHEDALFHRPEGGFDYVVGNPPYIRTHHLAPQTRAHLKTHFSLCKESTTDMYLAFYELGIGWLNEGGRLIYITPNMLMKNVAGRKFRAYLMNENLLQSIIDFGSQQVFDSISTYSCILHLMKGKKGRHFTYYTGEGRQIRPCNTFDTAHYLDRRFVFGTAEEMALLASPQAPRLAALCTPQYGICTMRDGIFITDNFEVLGDGGVVFNGIQIEGGLVRDMVKGSKLFMGDGLRRYKVIFPYEKRSGRWEVIGEERMAACYPRTLAYLATHRDELAKRDVERNTAWYAFGRSQGLQTSDQPKIAVDILVNKRVNMAIVGCDVLVYGGIFITAGEGVRLCDVHRILQSERFYAYARFVGKDLQNNYKSITTTMIKHYTHSVFP